MIWRTCNMCIYDLPLDKCNHVTLVVSAQYLDLTKLVRTINIRLRINLFVVIYCQCHYICLYRPPHIHTPILICTHTSTYLWMNIQKNWKQNIDNFLCHLEMKEMNNKSKKKLFSTWAKMNSLKRMNQCADIYNRSTINSE